MAGHAENPAVSTNNESQNELGEVRACDCGGVNLSMGPMTLHFAPDEVEALYELVYAAKELVEAAGHRTKRRSRRRRQVKAHGNLH